MKYCKIEVTRARIVLEESVLPQRGWSDGQVSLSLRQQLGDLMSPGRLIFSNVHSECILQQNRINCKECNEEECNQMVNLIIVLTELMKEINSELAS